MNSKEEELQREVENLTNLIMKIRKANNLRHAKLMIEEYLADQPLTIREIPSDSGQRRKGELPKICTEKSCYEDARARGLCARHYKQLQRFVGGRFTVD